MCADVTIAIDNDLERNATIETENCFFKKIIVKKYANLGYYDRYTNYNT